MTTFLLLRHSHSTANGAGILAGQLAGITLSEIGLKQSNEIAQSLRPLNINAIFSSPLERCLMTVQPLAQQRKKRIQQLEGIIEMNYGDWSGRKLNELAKEKLWRRIQKTPSRVTFPNGESFVQASRRIERTLTSLSSKHPKSTILICSHGDIIKIAVQLTVGSELDRFQRIIIDPASLTTVEWNGSSRTLIATNQSLTSKPKKKMRKKISSRRMLGGGSDV